MVRTRHCEKGKEGLREDIWIEKCVMGEVITSCTHVHNPHGVGEAKLGQDEEDGTVEVSDAILRQLLAEVDHSQQQGHNLQQEPPGVSRCEAQV